MNYVMDYRLIHCLRNGLPLDMDVYDAAEWSCITELSEKSVLNKSMAVEIPDFTRSLEKIQILGSIRSTDEVVVYPNRSSKR